MKEITVTFTEEEVNAILDGLMSEAQSAIELNDGVVHRLELLAAIEGKLKKGLASEN